MVTTYIQLHMIEAFLYHNKCDDYTDKMILYTLNYKGGMYVNPVKSNYNLLF